MHFDTLMSRDRDGVHALRPLPARFSRKKNIDFDHTWSQPPSLPARPSRAVKPRPAGNHAPTTMTGREGVRHRPTRRVRARRAGNGAERRLTRESGSPQITKIFVKKKPLQVEA